MDERFSVYFQDGRYGIIEDAEEKIADLADEFPSVIFYRKELLEPNVWVYTFGDELHPVSWPYPIEELVTEYPHSIYFYATLVPLED